MADGSIRISTELDTDELKSGLEGLGGVVEGMAKGVLAGMAAIGSAAVVAGKKLFDMAQNAAAAGQDVDLLSNKLGMSRTTLQEWDYILQQNGASTYYLSYGIRNLANMMGGSESGAEKLSKAMAALGTDFSVVENKSPAEAFEYLVGRLQEMPPGAEKAALAMQLFGRRGGMELMPLLNGTAESVDELRQRAHELGLIMSDDAIDAAVAFGNALTDFNLVMKAAKNTIGAEMLPGLTMLVEGLTGVVTGQEGATEKVREGAAMIISSISDMLPELLSLLLNVVAAIADVAPDILAALIEGIVDNIPLVIDTAVDLIAN